MNPTSNSGINNHEGEPATKPPAKLSSSKAAMPTNAPKIVGIDSPTTIATKVFFTISRALCALSEI